MAMAHDVRMGTGTRPYGELLAAGHEIYPGVRIGRPGRSRAYWATIAAMRVLRVRWRVITSGSDDVAPGAAILVGNHTSAMDPVVAVMSHWWRVTAFTKVEVFERRGAIFFRLMGQIPLRRGDETATTWALEMAASTLADGNKVGLYPEGTRAPDQGKLRRLHQRVMIPIIQACPDVPVHAICTTYPERVGRRRTVEVRLSPPLPIDASTMTPDEVTTVIRDALIDLGGLEYVDESAAAAKRRRAAEEA
jgi:1-acyl-sn-glycerol-3-phosphate acyltransferase